MIRARRGRIVVLALFPLFSCLYVCFAAPGPLFGDSGEFQTLGAVGGIAHQPGYPLYVIVGRCLGRMLPGNPARRMNCMSCLFGGVAVAMLGLVLIELGLSATAAVAGAVVYGMSFTVWWFSIRAEVYSLAVFVFLAVLLSALRAFRSGSRGAYGLTAVLTGFALVSHISFAPPLLVLWSWLLLFSPLSGRSRLVRAGIAAIGLAVGLTPYLYAAWIDAGAHPLNYLAYTIDADAGQYGLTSGTFDEPWERLSWLLLGTQARMQHYLFDPRGIARNLAHLLSIEYVYHYGIFAPVLVLIGIVSARRSRDRRLALVFAMTAAAAVFVLLYGALHLMPVYSLPVAIGNAILVAFGIAALVGHLRGKSHRTAALVTAMIAVVLVVVPAHLLRVAAERSDAFPARWRMPLEIGPRMTGAFPSLRGYGTARTFGEAVLASAPDGSLVTGNWYEMIVLFYLHYAEEVRPDIELEVGYIEHFGRIRRWAESREPAPHPVVFLEEIPGLTDRFTPCDTLRTCTGRCLLVSDGCCVTPSSRSGGRAGP
ncbi:MAG: DUF2723 domain-containing protein [Candidatus Krumholzibacteriota bacterium]|nr:DUF2723 domain-containing protein [Candidatus Krumholzibacteriota bacterium]